jgi:hypothetical protein
VLLVVAFLLFSVTAILFGCGGGSGSAGAASDGGSGTLSLHLTDATTLAYSAVYVTIDRVDVHMGENDRNGGADTWKTVVTPVATYNLLELVNGVMRRLGVSELDAGRYIQMRLIIGTTPDDGDNLLSQPHPYANYLIMADTDNTIHELKIPSGPQTGIKLVREFDIEANQLTELVLDFDASRSIVKAGRSGLWLLKPTIKVLDTATMAVIEGRVVDESGTALEDALVSAQFFDVSAIGPFQEVLIEAASPTNASGEFSMLVRPGVYNIVAGKPGYATATGCRIDVWAGEVVPLDGFSLNTLETDGEQTYATLSVHVDLQAYEDVEDLAISIRSAACGAMVQVGSEKISDGGTSDFYLPAGDYEIVAWHPESQLLIYQDDVVLEEGKVTSVQIGQ